MSLRPIREGVGEGISTGLVLLIVGAVVIALGIGAYLVSNRVVYEPYRQEGFSGQVQGLVTEYCTAPRAVDQKAARVALDSLLSEKPERVKELSDGLKAKARQVVHDDREVCK